MPTPIHPCYIPLYEDTDKPVILVTGGRGCEAPETEVIMADLSVKQIKDIKVGELVMGDDFMPRRVLGVTSGRSVMYRVHQTSSDDYFVNEEHILTLQKSESSKREGRYRCIPDIVDINVCEFAKKSRRFREHFRGFKVGSIPYKSQEVRIDPYLLGLWLGDGTSVYPNITNGDHEVIEWIERYRSENNQRLEKKKRQGAYQLRIVGRKLRAIGGNPFLNSLKEYGLLGNKHIPQAYISNSEEIRLELLAGLVDTDGYMYRNGYEIIQKSYTLAKQIKFVADSLGFRTSMREKRASIGDKNCGIHYRILINGDTWKIPCKVQRKRVEKSDCHKNKDWSLSQVSIEPAGVGDWCGLFLDGNHRYLHSDGTVTHNSGKSFEVSRFIERLTFEKGQTILFSRYTMTSAEKSIIPEIIEKIEGDGTSEYFSVTGQRVTNRSTGSGIIFMGIKTSSGNQTAKMKSIQGLSTFVCDEAEEWVSEEEFDKVALSIRKEGVRNRIIIVMNPTSTRHFIYQRFIKDNHTTKLFDGVPVQISTHPDVLHIHSTYLDNLEHLNPEFLHMVETIKEKDPEKYAQVVIGRWSDSVDGRVFSEWQVVDEIPKYATQHGIGIDFGYTQDPTAIVHCAVHDDTLFIDELCYQRGLFARDIAAILRPYNHLKAIADSADPRFIDEIALLGIPRIEGVLKGKGSIEAGIDKMRSMKIAVTARSVNLIEELNAYTFAKGRWGQVLNIPEDGADHLIDAARYYVLYQLLGRRRKPQSLQGIFP